ncbi:lipase family protein [Variovorax sp. W2I14]|uniref:lipase family protein n=1 Tax=Variovorax sp. W2I14 TaxID=3042290 RepID=UPI003D22AF63
MIDFDPSRSALYTPEQRGTVFSASQAYSIVQLGLEASRLAYLRAEVSASQRQTLSQVLGVIGFGAPRMFSDPQTNTQAFGAFRRADRTALLAFRGTQPDEVGDLGTDLQADMVPWPEAAGRVHAGFATAFRAIRPALVEWLDSECAERSELILSGHSLGAALATLAATVWQPAQLVTLGSPRVGNPEFAAALVGVPVTRVVNCCDAVTQIPPESPWYTHVAPMTYVRSNGTVVLHPEGSEVLGDRLEARARYLVQHAWRAGAVLVRDLADHAPINYVRAFFP